MSSGVCVPEVSVGEAGSVRVCIHHATLFALACQSKNAGKPVAPVSFKLVEEVDSLTACCSEFPVLPRSHAGLYLLKNLLNLFKCEKSDKGKSTAAD